MSNYPRYRIEYLDIGMIQEKNLIPQEIYNGVIMPAKKVILEIESFNNGKPTNKSKELKSWLSNKFGENVFTDQSALFNSIKTGVLNCNNYTQRVKIELK